MNEPVTVDRVLRRYLLGAAEPAVREDIERRLFSDDAIFWEQLCLAEDELVDDYVRGELSDDEARQFDECFLTTGERRDKLDFARALAARAGRVEAPVGIWQRVREWLAARLLVPAWAASAAAVLVVALPAVVWLTATKPGSPPDTAASVWITSGLVRTVGGELARVSVAPGVKVVELRLEADDGPTRYRATLHRVEGGELLTLRGLAAASVDGRPAVSVPVPADLLPPGDYFVRLAPDGAEVPALRGSVVPIVPAGDRYDFRVLR